MTVRILRRVGFAMCAAAFGFVLLPHLVSAARHAAATPAASGTRALAPVALAAATSASPAAPAAARSTLQLADEARAGVEMLASDRMEGRGLDTRGIRLAADWIEEQLRAGGLEPAFGQSFRQPFQVKTGVSLAAGNRVEGLADSLWVPLGFSSNGPISGELAFLGYGIEAPPLGYDEFAGVDLAGKVALVLRYEPQEKDELSPFDGRKPSRWSALRYKAMKARERGATAVIFTTGPLQDEGKDKLPALTNDGPESPAGLPVIQVRTSVAQRWLTPLGIDLKRFQEEVDRDLRARSRGTTGVRIAGNVALDAAYATTDNLAGVIPGRGALAGEVIVLGAHYDHLGWGGHGSLRPNEYVIHNGADDNASGTVSVLIAARELGRALEREPSHRTVVAALFSGEEVGLAGSSWFVGHPPGPISSVSAMVNLDMVGDLRGDTLIALGSDSAPEWKSGIEKAAAATGLTVTGRGDGYGPSDQTSFYAAGIPVLHLFTGAHARYHTPDDRPETVNPAGMARVVEFATALVADLARRPAPPAFARSTAAPPASGDSRGYGAWLGTVPDFSAMDSAEKGVLLGDVRAGGPAELAGMRKGDRIISMAGTRIENLYDMTYALQDHKPGETIEVRVLRGGDPLTLKATLGDRTQMGAPGPGAAPSGPGMPPMPAGPGSPAASPVSGAPPASPATPPGPAPPAPHGAPAAESPRPKLPPPDAGPGPDFKPGAGKPFDQRFEGEAHLADIRQLTFGGDNAEPYWSPDGRSIVFQATVPGVPCDRIYTMDLATGAVKQVSSGRGRTTCAYFDYPEMDRIVYSSTEAGADTCPPPPDLSQGYVWAIYPTYDIYEANRDGSNARRLTTTPGYDAEATWSHRGGRIIFTSMRDGDLDLYSMDETGGDVKRLTNRPGYDGGAFYSPDGSEIVWRADYPQGKELETYRALLAQNLIRPHQLEIFIANADGSNVRQLTSNGAANFCPTFLADNQRIIWASNVNAGWHQFDLWLIDKNGGAPERVTTAPGFDAFPHISPDGRWIVWSSNRANPEGRDTNLFLARWVEGPEVR